MLKRPVDLSSCDTEPIHMIGGIQPIGALVAVDEATMTIEFASRNTDAYFGHDCAALLGQPLSALLGDDNCAQLLRQNLQPSTPDLLKPWFVALTKPDGTRVDFECFAHRHEGRIILEFVTLEAGPAAVWEEDLLRQRIISELIRPDTLTDLAQVGAQIIRDVTGFDRVMIYRFAEDQHGEVIAESTVRSDSFLGLHYPASDIPDPARRHFVLNVIRIIPDINAAPVPIMTRTGVTADAFSDNPLDLTYSKLRAVAPVHIEYLNNMGVGASHVDLADLQQRPVGARRLPPLRAAAHELEPAALLRAGRRHHFGPAAGAGEHDPAAPQHPRGKDRLRDRAAMRGAASRCARSSATMPRR